MQHRVPILFKKRLVFIFENRPVLPMKRELSENQPVQMVPREPRFYRGVIGTGRIYWFLREPRYKPNLFKAKF